MASGSPLRPAEEGGEMRCLQQENNATSNEIGKPLDPQTEQRLPSESSGQSGAASQKGERNEDHEGTRNASPRRPRLSTNKFVVGNRRKSNGTGDEGNDDDDDEDNKFNTLLDDFYRNPLTKPQVPFYLGKHQVDILECEFKTNQKPTTRTKRQFAKDLKVPLDKINVCSLGYLRTVANRTQNWFTTRRHKRRRNQGGATEAFEAAEHLSAEKLVIDDENGDEVESLVDNVNRGGQDSDSQSNFEKPAKHRQVQSTSASSRQPDYRAIDGILTLIEQGKRPANPDTMPPRDLINKAIAANNGVLHPRLKDRLEKVIVQYNKNKHKNTYDRAPTSNEADPTPTTTLLAASKPDAISRKSTRLASLRDAEHSSTERGFGLGDSGMSSSNKESSLDDYRGENLENDYDDRRTHSESSEEVDSVASFEDSPSHRRDADGDLSMIDEAFDNIPLIPKKRNNASQMKPRKSQDVTTSYFEQIASNPQKQPKAKTYYKFLSTRPVENWLLFERAHWVRYQKMDLKRSWNQIPLTFHFNFSKTHQDFLAYKMTSTKTMTSWHSTKMERQSSTSTEDRSGSG
jgi:hypothetical protein